MIHVDDFIETGSEDELSSADKTNEDYARWVLKHFRLPAYLKMDFDRFMRKHKLFCKHEGVKYRVTGASRLGDVWLTEDFSQTHGYDKRVDVNECSNWGSK